MTDKRPATDPPRPAGAQPADYVRSVLDRAHEAFVAMDAGGFVIDWNRQAERTFGWTREEAVGRVLAHLIIPERDRAAHLQGLEHYNETGEGPILDQRHEL
ncbi:MAG: PAS domain S-box protein, partial [Solirubrobacterales bacterium]|nr:PAS domain S-box protein [Solirubrobacterales bacterium]